MTKMFRLFLKLYTIAAIVVAILTVRQCSDGIREKKEPEYHGVDPEVQPVLDQFLRISSENNIVFNNRVTIGLKNINEGGAVGICNYGKGWREIDVDRSYWESASEATQYALLFHELTHCYCGRDHDFADGKPYKTVKELKEENQNGEKHSGGGFYKDNCPTSLMYPIVVDDECLLLHYDDYKKEMLERCEPF